MPRLDGDVFFFGTAIGISPQKHGATTRRTVKPSGSRAYRGSPPQRLDPVPAHERRRQASIGPARAARAWTVPAMRRTPGRGAFALRRLGLGSIAVSSAASPADNCDAG